MIVKNVRLIEINTQDTVTTENLEAVFHLAYLALAEKSSSAFVTDNNFIISNIRDEPFEKQNVLNFIKRVYNPEKNGKIPERPHSQAIPLVELFGSLQGVRAPKIGVIFNKQSFSYLSTERMQKKIVDWLANHLYNALED